jgi:DNA-binding NtrC family response regulator
VSGDENLVMDFDWVWTRAAPEFDRMVDGDLEVCLNTSSGTPKMAFVWWTLALSMGSKRARCFESSPERGVIEASLPRALEVRFLEDRLTGGLLHGVESDGIRLRPDFARDFIGVSDAIKSVKIKAQEVARFVKYPVLILGPPGSGKSTLAEAIHRESGRPIAAWRVVDCGSLQDSVSRHSLTGWRKGSFTDAKESRAGDIVGANGGTLFLDEIGNAPLETQAQLLRFLQTRRVKPLGGEESQPLDVRIIAATNIDLRAAVREGRFRQDLLDRLRFVEIHIPPLRDRLDDVMPLAEAMLAQFNRDSGPQLARMNRPIRRFGAGVDRVLRQHDWPGNVREIEFVVARLAIFSDPHREVISKDAVARELAQAREGPTAPILGRPMTDGVDLERVLDEVRFHYIERAFASSRGSRSAAAVILRLGRTALTTMERNLSPEFASRLPKIRRAMTSPQGSGVSGDGKASAD